MKRTKRFVSCLLFAFAIATGTATASEIALRMTGHVSTAGVPTVTCADYSRISGLFEPNQDVVEKPHPRSHYHVMSKGLGYKGRAIPSEKPDETVEVLLMGDAGTFLQFVNKVDAFPRATTGTTDGEWALRNVVGASTRSP